MRRRSRRSSWRRFPLLSLLTRRLALRLYRRHFCLRVQRRQEQRLSASASRTRRCCRPRRRQRCSCRPTTTTMKTTSVAFLVATTTTSVAAVARSRRVESTTRFRRQSACRPIWRLSAAPRPQTAAVSRRLSLDAQLHFALQKKGGGGGGALTFFVFWRIHIVCTYPR